MSEDKASWWIFFHRFRYVLLIAILLLLGLVSPTLEDNRSDRVVAAILFSLSMFICTLSWSAKRTLQILFLSGSAILTLVWLFSAGEHTSLGFHLIGRGGTLMFYAPTAALVVIDVFKGGKVDHNRICGAICVYLLMGILFGQVYQLLDALNPDNFYISPTSIGHGKPLTTFQRANILTYFSFITISTAGYGDIVPATGLSRALASIEAITGQMYLSILVARLVSLYGAEAAAEPKAGADSKTEKEKRS